MKMRLNEKTKNLTAMPTCNNPRKIQNMLVFPCMKVQAVIAGY